MAETYAEVSNKYVWREPSGPWRVLCVLYVLAMTLYAVMCVTEATTWAAYAGLVVFEPESAVLFDQVVRVLNGFIAPLYVVCAITTLVLMHRLVSNAHAANSPEGLTGPGMAVAAFLIPFVSLFMPPLVMGQLWRATFAKAGGRSPNGLIAFWWTAFLIGSVTGTYVTNATGGWFNEAPPPEEQMQDLLAVNTFSFLCRTLAASTLLYIFGALVKQQKAATHADVFD